MKLTHGTGFFRLFFNQIKEATTDNTSAITRMFITGVTPLTLSDVTSGFNIGLNLSMNFQFNEAMGFSESEVRTMLEYYRDVMGTFQHSVDELIDIMKPYYNNSCFCEESLEDDRMFNSDMVLYFLTNYVPCGILPKNLIDSNVASDDEVAEYYNTAISQLKAYSNSHPFAQECSDHSWQLHNVALIVRGWKMVKLEEV